MEHVTELQVERLLVSPEEMPPPARAHIVNHLLRCSTCRRAAEVQIAFYDELYRADDSGTRRPSLKGFLDQLLAPDDTPTKEEPRAPGR